MKCCERFKKDSKFAMLVLLGLVLVLMVLFAILVGFKIRFWLMLIVFIAFFFKFKILFKASFMFTIAIFFVFFILTITWIVRGVENKTTSSGGSSTSSKKLTSDECKPFVEKYNNKVLKISGNNVIGSIGVKINPDDCKLSARYIIALNAELADNPIPEIAVSSYYNYVNNLHSSSETTRGHYGVGVLSQARRNAMALPDPYSNSTQVAAYYRDQSDQGVVRGSSWYWSYEVMTNFSEARYQQLLDDNVFEVIDGLPYMQKESSASGGFSYSIDQEKAEKEGQIVKTFNLTISE